MADDISVAGGTAVAYQLDGRDENTVSLALLEAITDTLDVVIPATAVLAHPPTCSAIQYN